jgi:citronellol/citronellal dehydrogenase
MATDTLKGRVALVTGGSRGIGAAIARDLGQAGAAVAVNYRARADEANAVVEALRRAGAKAIPVQADVAQAADVERMIARVTSELGPIDILVNNAAAAFYAPTADLPLRRRRLLFELNVHAPVDLAQQVIPGMRARGRGWILNVSSATSRHAKGPPFDAGIKLGSTSTLYGATKSALERITTGLAAELYDDGIAVNSLAPVAAVRTPGAEVHLGPLLDERPDIVEPVELVADAAVVLSTCDPATMTGRVVYSRPFLRELGLPTDR